MRVQGVARLASVVGLMVLACAPAAPASPGPSAVPQAAPVATSAAGSWDSIVAAARQEGSVVIVGPAGNDVANALTQGFQATYPDIQVELSGVQGDQAPPKLIAEQSAQKYITDLVIQGTTTITGQLRDANVVVPIDPYLVGPDDDDPSVWLNHEWTYADPETRTNLIMAGYPQIAFAYNPQMVSPSEFTSWRDLLDPKWKGKIAMRDPRGAGPTLGRSVTWYQDDRLGKQFIQDLLVGQQVQVSSDDRQLLDWVAHGQYPIALGPSNTLLDEDVRQGLPLAMLDGAQMAEGTYISVGNSTLGIMAHAPHPNALKVYLDWLLSRDGQDTFARAEGYPSFRRDLPTDWVPDMLVTKDGVQYRDGYSEKYVAATTEVVQYLKTVLGAT